MMPAPADLGPRARALNAAADAAHFDLTAELDTIHARERAFCRDFRCCGATLADLYELLEHYEECHLDADMAMFMALGHANSGSGNASVAPTAAHAAADLLPGAAAAADTRASLPNPLLDLIALHSNVAAPPASLHATAAPIAGPTRDPMAATNGHNDIVDDVMLPRPHWTSSTLLQASPAHLVHYPSPDATEWAQYVLSPPLSPAPVSTTHSRAASTTGGTARIKRARTPASPASPSPRTLTGDTDMADASPLTTATLHKRRKSTHAAADRAHLRALTIPAVSIPPSPSPSPGTDLVRPASVGPALGKFPAPEPRAKSASPRPRVDRQHARAGKAPGGSARSPLAKSVVVMGGEQAAAPVPFARLEGPRRASDAPDQNGDTVMGDSTSRPVSPTPNTAINSDEEHEDGEIIVTDEDPRPPSRRATLPPRPSAVPDLVMVTRHRAQLAALAKSTVVRAVSTRGPPPLISCPIAGCTKTYQSTNGLKYHLGRMHADELGMRPVAATAAAATSEPAAAAAAGPAAGVEPTTGRGAPAGGAGTTGRRRNPAV
ncbi:hypothetical protein AMAG_00557 [Allomyces macrogynus ATCC 38327]|uniref:C2H2-type domain-containing protein n=1 Tax=Allomyces macrogynus (strain ATCC 38327) TaxID=578462 RepID=A0A0L0RW17_ALLM3|nr:hypothetical protein AMAG_00557 [Allomyces macrogynus ATCC 38327]|eukprot:KNE54592.1 hypothetical protein AMAG_00557 [Allomyces macrogynus ATCC 38327]